MTEAQKRAYDQAQVMLAFSQGKKIEWKPGNEKEWRHFDKGDGKDSPSWNWLASDYRIAPEPQEVWLWVKEGFSPCTNDVTTLSGNMEKLGYTKKLFREVLS